MLRHSLGALGLITGALLIGVLGYHFTAGLSWVDSLLNAAMILAGMGPVDPLYTPGAKIFASAYALFSGVVFLVIAGVMFAPLFHRFLHYFHLELDED
jgi:hypothetical protein